MWLGRLGADARPPANAPEPMTAAPRSGPIGLTPRPDYVLDPPGSGPRRDLLTPEQRRRS